MVNFRDPDWQAQSFKPSSAPGVTPQTIGPTTQTQPSYQAFNNMWNLGMAANASNDASINNKLSLSDNQLNHLLGGFDTQYGLLQQQNNLQQQQYGLQDQGIAVQQGALNRQNALLPQQQGLANQALDIMGKQIDLSGQGLGLQGQNLDIADQRRGLQQDAAARAYGQQINSMLGGAAARGAVNSTGTRQDRSNLDFGYGQQQQGFGLDAQAAALQRQQLGLSGQGLDLNRQQLGVERGQSALNYDEQKAKLADSQKQLDLTSKQMGLSREETSNRVNQAISQLGLSTQLSADAIFQAKADMEAGRYNPIQQILGTIYQMTGIRPLASAQDQIAMETGQSIP